MIPRIMHCQCSLKLLLKAKKFGYQSQYNLVLKFFQESYNLFEKTRELISFTGLYRVSIA